MAGVRAAPALTVLPIHPALELISFSQIVCQEKQGLCYLMPPERYQQGLSERLHLGMVVRWP